MLAINHTCSIVSLVLDESEAKWLKNIMQNPLNGQQVEDENKIDRFMRKRLFDTLTEAGVKE